MTTTPNPDRVDTLRDILDVAVSVVLDHASDPGMTRIERLARFVVGVLGVTPFGADRPQVEWLLGQPTPMVHVVGGFYSAASARALAAYLLDAADRVDEVG